MQKIITSATLSLFFFVIVSCNNSADNKKTDTVSPKNDTIVSNNPAPPATQKDFQYEPAISVISGTIATEMFYGPPGFGENPKTDKKEDIYLLVPDQPVNVIGPADQNEEDNNTTKNNIVKIQLIFPETINPVDYKNKKVRLSGTFFGPETGHHHTDVLLDVQKLEEL